MDALAVIDMLADEAAYAAVLCRTDGEASKFAKAASDAVRARRVFADLIDSHARLLALCESCGLPKVADDLMPLAEARRVIASLAGAAP